VGLSRGAGYIDVAVGNSHCRSCLSRANNFGHRDVARSDRRAGLFFLAEVRGDLTSPLRFQAAKSFCYACKIKETTNGGWRGALGQTRKTFQEIAARRIERNVQFDEQSRTSASGQDQA